MSTQRKPTVGVTRLPTLGEALVDLEVRAVGTRQATDSLRVLYDDGAHLSPKAITALKQASVALESLRILCRDELADYARRMAPAAQALDKTLAEKGSLWDLAPAEPPQQEE